MNPYVKMRLSNCGQKTKIGFANSAEIAEQQQRSNTHKDGYIL